MSSSLNSLAQSVQSVPASAWATAGGRAGALGAAANLVKASGVVQGITAAIEENMNPFVGGIILGVFDYALANAVWDEAKAALNGQCTAN